MSKNEKKSENKIEYTIEIGAESKTEKAYSAAIAVNSKDAEVGPISAEVFLCDLCQQDVSEMSEEQKKYFMNVKTELVSVNAPQACYLLTVMNNPSYGVARCALSLIKNGYDKDKYGNNGNGNGNSSGNGDRSDP